jgi:hypothetical protein
VRSQTPVNEGTGVRAVTADKAETAVSKSNSSIEGRDSKWEQI